jgi:hypothetical protein
MGPPLRNLGRSILPKHLRERGGGKMSEATILDGRHVYRPQTIGRVFGWFFLATFLTSIPAYFIGYGQDAGDPEPDHRRRR